MTTREAMAEQLQLDPSSPTKTFVLDVHADESVEPIDFLAQALALPGRVHSTEDAYLFRADVEDETFWVDQLDSRFWSFHTDMSTARAQSFLRERVEARRDLDWIWLPSEHLRHSWPDARFQRVRTDFSGRSFLGEDEKGRDLKLQASGKHAEQLLTLLGELPGYRSAVSLEGVQMAVSSPGFGGVVEGIDRMGKFAVTGDSFELHLQLVERVVRRYGDFVRRFEDQALAWTPSELGSGNGGSLAGRAIIVTFSRTIPDMDRFLNELLAARQPFRLWGAPVVRDGVAEVEGVDLHVGQRLRLDVGPQWMRIYLESGACGNTVARLLANLQHRFDSALTLVDPTLQAAFVAENELVVAG